MNIVRAESLDGLGNLGPCLPRPVHLADRSRPHC